MRPLLLDEGSGGRQGYTRSLMAALAPPRPYVGSSPRYEKPNAKTRNRERSCLPVVGFIRCPQRPDYE
jgi:hypothetical protein